MAIDITQNPYYDNFDENKNFHKILFRPSFAVQARELTQSQTILQDQVTKFARNIFQNGSIVTGGQTLLEVSRTKYVCIEATDPLGNEVDVNNFIGKFVIDGDGDGVRAYVIAGAAATTTSPTYLIVKYTSGQEFDVATTQPIATEDGAYSVDLLASLLAPVAFTDVVSGSILGDASICSINEGVFFVGGFFVHVAPQTVVLDAFENTPSYRVGLEIEEEIIDATEDSSLLDPAQESTNFQAPGADRLKISLTFTKRILTSTDDTKFIELLRVVDGRLTKNVVYPTYSVLEATMARRMDDQSGSFTVRPFRCAFEEHELYANAFYVVVEAGKAYIQGFEFETIAPTYIKVERARTVANVSEFSTTIDYQNWLEVTKLVGPIPFTTLQAGTIHCVNTASIMTTNTGSAANTVIGTVRIRALDYQSGANGTSISTGVWRVYMFDANVGQSVVANSASTGGNNYIFLGPNFSPVSNAYAGVKITVTANAGVALNEHYQIGHYDGANNRAVLTSPATFDFGIPGVMTQFRLDYEMKDAESIVYANTRGVQHVFSTTMDVNGTSKVSALVDRFQSAFLTDTDFIRPFFTMPYADVADLSVVGGLPVSNIEYTGRKIYTGQSFTADVSIVTSLAGITALATGAPLSGSDAVDNILVIVRNATGASIANNQVINFSSGNPGGNTVTVTTASNTSTWTITVPGMGSASAADVYVKVFLPHADVIGNLLRSKTAHIANSASGLNSGGIQIPDATGLVQWYSQAGGVGGVQVTFHANSAAWLNLKDSTLSQSVYTSDVTRINKIIDTGTAAITDGNVAAAADITARYTLDTGQRDTEYNHGSIKLKAGSTGPLGNVVVYLDYLTHSGIGFLTVDSYASANIAYADIPSYISPSTGAVYELRDCIDFRPRRQDGDFNGVFDETVFGLSGLNFQNDFSYYFSRIDKLVLTKDREFEIVTGIPSLSPMTPSNKDNAMTLYTFQIPAYTAAIRDIRQRYTDNRRYTMRDIGVLEKRITNLEYYTSLNMLEQAAKNQEITDDVGGNRFKNGILVDSFTGHSIGDVQNPDYYCAMDPQNQELRPPFSVEALGLELEDDNSYDYARTGATVSVPYTVDTYIDQPFSAIAVNVNPFNTVSWVGLLTLDPSSDVWIEKNRLPDILVNNEGDSDEWAFRAAQMNKNSVGQTINGQTFGMVWNSWQTTWTGVSKNDQIINPAWVGNSSAALLPIYRNIISRHTVTTTQQQARSGIETFWAPEVVQTSLGDRVVNQSIIPRMRSRGIIFMGKMLAPNTNVFAFFDEVAVTNYVVRPDIIKVNDVTIAYQDNYQNFERVRVWDPARGANTAKAFVVLNRHEQGGGYTNVTVISVTGGDDANIANAYVRHSSNSTFLIGETSGSNSRISGFYHNSGFVTNANISSFILQHDAANANNALANTDYVGMTVYFTSANSINPNMPVQDSGAAQSATIDAYNKVTGNIHFTPNITVTANTQMTYSIGQMSTDFRGEITGVFVIPSSNALSFRTGERPFAIVDSSSGDFENSVTNGLVNFTSSGLIQTVQNTVISTRQMSIQRRTVQDRRFVTSSAITDTIVGRQIVGYYDPLAETFMIDGAKNPSGIMLTGIRLLFKTKDDNIPVQVQLRPVVNGFPHSSQIIPGTDIVVNPENVNVITETALGIKYAAESDNNPLDDATMYTQVNFNGPIYLQPGTEYAVVLIANTIKYQVYVSEMGKKLIGTERTISEQPYLGSFFKSQNASTWTPIQEQDLAFRLLYARFSVGVTSNVEFTLSPDNNITANVPIDAFYLMSGNLLLPNTTISSQYASTTETGIRETYRTFQLEQNLFYDDTLGRRVASSDITSYKLRLFLNTVNPDVSPLIDMDRLSLFAVENQVNNLELNQSIVNVILSSNNWTNASNITLTITGGGGSGANVRVANTNIDANTGAMANAELDVVGSGYTTAPTITASGNSQVDVIVAVSGEDHAFGGPAVARYITRKVTLDTDMDAGDFRVYFDAYFPLSAEIYVYYKILSADDTDVFDNKGYQLMTIVSGANQTSINQRDIKGYVYAPGVNGVAANRVQYDSFTTFRTFAIKVVMASTDPTKVPRIRNFRVVALPALS